MFGSGDVGPILMSGVNCSGDESQLTKCQHYVDQKQVSCNMVKSAGVICDAKGNLITSFTMCVTTSTQLGSIQFIDCLYT